MAQSGSLNTTGYHGRYLVFSWSQQSQSISDNSTTINWELQGAGKSAEDWYNSGNYTVRIDGEVVYSHPGTLTLKHQVVASGTKTIRHNSDGSRDFSVSVTAGIYAYTSTNASGSASFNLDQIMRRASITSAPDFNDEENPTFYYTNPAGDIVTSVEACISLNGGIDIPYREISKTGSSYQFVLTETERNVLRNATVDSNSRSIYFYVRTTINGTQYTNRVARTFTVINALPTMDPIVYDVDVDALESTGNKDNFIAGYSDAAFVINAKAHKGATISAEYVINGSQKNWNDSGTLENIDNGEFTFAVADSRGNVVTKTIKKNCYSYSPASVSITGAKLTADGTLTISFTGNLYSGTFGKTENDNKHFAYYQIKEQGGVWSGWKSVSSLIKFGNYNTYTVDVPITGLDYTKTYVVKAAIEDTFTWRQTGEKVVISRPIFDWGKDDFRFNCRTVFGPIYSLGGIPPENYIPSSSDFDTYKKPGVYCVGTNDDMGTMINRPPITSAGRLIVVSSLGNVESGGIWSYIIQKFIPYTATSGSWIRHAIIGSTPGKWSYSKWNLELTAEDTDYIVAQGTSGVWSYRKWISGKAECWGSLENSGPISEIWGSDFCGVYDKYLDYPFSFIGTPVEIATLHTTGFGGSLYTEGTNTSSHSAKYGVVRSASYSGTANITVDIYVCGNWK